MIALIEAVRQARKNGHNWIAMDKDKRLHSYGGDDLTIDTYPGFEHWNTDFDYEFLGEFNPPCSWKDTLIEVSKIKVF